MNSRRSRRYPGVLALWLALAWWGSLGAAPAPPPENELFRLLVLDANEQNYRGLRARPELAQIRTLVEQKQEAQALRLFREYYLGKLRYPGRYGLTAADVNPYLRGVAGAGDWPGNVLDPKADPKAVLATADELLAGRMRQGEQVVALGPPGQVNWTQAPPPSTGNPAPEPYPALTFAGALRPLAHAWLLTHQDRYLQAWAAYMDDWAQHADYLATVPPCEVSDGANGALGNSIQTIRLLGGLAAALPADSELIPPETLARILTKLLRQHVLPSVAYIRSNTHNWTPSAHLVLLALYLDEFQVAPELFREGRRRGIEDNCVTQNLRDGTENQQCPWYNPNFLSVAEAFRLLDARRSLAPWAEPRFVRDWRQDLGWRVELQEHLDARLNYFIHLRTPQNEWPIVIRGSDKRSAGGLPGDDWYALGPNAYNQPENRLIAAAILDPRGGKRPSYTSEWFPYAGYNLVREGWEKDSGHGFLFCSPQPGAYGGFRSRSNNNAFGLAAYGWDLLVDDTTGHYMYPSSPIRVDGLDQFFHAGVYKVQPPAAHKVYQVSAWTEPAPWRWHASERFNLMEGVYAGPYGRLPDPKMVSGPYGADESMQGTLPLEQTLRGIEHQRLVHYVRGAGLWIVTDRMTSAQSHRYEQLWYLPVRPPGYAPFAPTDIEVIAAAKRVATHATSGEGEKGPAPANLSMQQFCAMPLSYRETVAPPQKRGDRIMMYGWKAVAAQWQGQGPQQIVTAIFPRRPGAPADGDLQDVQTLPGSGDVYGFRCRTPDGSQVQYLASAGRKGALPAGRLAAQGEALLVQQAATGGALAGLALGCTQISLDGQALAPPGADFEFALASTPGAAPVFTPIYRPIAPVEIAPARNVFVGQLEVTLSSRTPGVEIRYTHDGSEPTPQSALYRVPLQLNTTTVLKARAYRPGATANPPQLSGTHATVVSRAVFTKAEPLRPPVPPRKVAPGLSCKYFAGPWQDLWLFRDLLAPQAQGVVPALFDLSLVPATNAPLGEAAAPRQQYFALEYSGFLAIPADGVYTLHAPREYVYPDTEAGYELQVYLGEEIIPLGGRTQAVGLNLWYPATRLHAFGNWSVPLAKGLQPFRVVYVDFRAGSARKLNRSGLRDYVWSGVVPDLRISGPGLDRQPIPAEWLTHAQ